MNYQIPKNVSLSLVLCLITSILILFINYYLIKLTENSILYLHATSAQIVSACVGLSLVAYSHLSGELSRRIENSSDSEESLKLTKKKAFNDLILILFIGAVSISSSLTTLIMFQHQNFLNFFINFSCLTVILFTYVLIKFIHHSFSPDAIQKNNDEILDQTIVALEKMDASRPKTQTINPVGFDDSNIGDSALLLQKAILGNFVMQFLVLEDLLREVHSKYNYHSNQGRPLPLSMVIKELFILQIIPLQVHNKLQSLRNIRNTLVHSSNKTNLTEKQIKNWIGFMDELTSELEKHNSSNHD